MQKYNIIRFYLGGKKRIIKRNVFLFEAQKHCRNIETSWRTCTLSKNIYRTKRLGPWFDGFIKL